MMIGKGEYNKIYCEGKLDLLEGEKAALFEDYVKKSFPPSDNIQIGCCRVPEGKKKLKKMDYCIYTKDYKYPTYKDKAAAFLKRFK